MTSTSKSDRGVSAEVHCWEEAQLSGCLQLIKESSGQAAADKLGPYILEWTTMALLQPLTVWSEPVLLFLPVSFFSLSYITFFSGALTLLPFLLYFPFFIPFYSAPFLCPFPLLSMAVREGRSCSDRLEQRQKKTGLETISCWALHELQARSAAGNMSVGAAMSHRWFPLFSLSTRDEL